MKALSLHLMTLLAVTGFAWAQDPPPVISYGRVTMNSSPEYEWLDLFGIAS